MEETKPQLRRLHGVYLKELFKKKKKEPGDGFLLWTGLFELRLSAFATEMRWRGTCIVTQVEIQKEKACVCAF